MCITATLIAFLLACNGITAFYTENVFKKAPTTIEALSKLPQPLKRFVTITKKDNKRVVDIKILFYEKIIEVVDD